MTATTSSSSNLPPFFDLKQMGQDYVDIVLRSVNRPHTIGVGIKTSLSELKRHLPTVSIEHRTFYFKQFLSLRLDVAPIDQKWIRNKTFQTLWESLYSDPELFELAKEFSNYVLNTPDTEHFCYSIFSPAHIHYFLRCDWENCLLTAPSLNHSKKHHELALIAQIASSSMKANSILTYFSTLKTTPAEVKNYIATFLHDPENFENKPKASLFMAECQILYCFLCLMINQTPTIPIPYILAPYWVQQQLTRRNTVPAPSLAPAPTPRIQMAETVSTVPTIQIAATPPQLRIQPMPKKAASSTPVMPTPKPKETKKRPPDSKKSSNLQPQLKKTALNTKIAPKPTIQLLSEFVPAVAEQFLIAKNREFETFFRSKFLHFAPPVISEEEGRAFWLQIFDGVWNYLEQKHEDSGSLFKTVYNNIFLCFEALQSRADHLLIYTFCDVVITLFQGTKLFDSGSSTDRKVRTALWSECWVTIVDLFKEKCPENLFQFQIWVIALRQRMNFKYEQFLAEKNDLTLSQDIEATEIHFQANQPRNALEFPFWLIVNWNDRRLNYLPDNKAIISELKDFLEHKRPQGKFREHFPLLDDYCALSDKTNPLKPIPFVFWYKFITPRIRAGDVKHNIFHTLSQESLPVESESYSKEIDHYDLMDPKPLVRMFLAKLFHPHNGIPYEKIQRNSEKTRAIEELFEKLFNTYFLPQYDEHLKTSYKNYLDYVRPKIEKFWVGLAEGILEHREFAKVYLEALSAYLSRNKGRLFIIETFMKAAMPMLLKSGIFDNKIETEADALYAEVLHYFIKGNYSKVLELLENSRKNQDKRCLQIWVIIQEIQNQFKEETFLTYTQCRKIKDPTECLDAYYEFKAKAVSLSKQRLVSKYPILYSYFFHCKVHNKFDTKRPILPLLAHLWLTERVNANKNDTQKKFYVSYLNQAVTTVANFDRWEPVVTNKKEKQPILDY